MDENKVHLMAQSKDLMERYKALVEIKNDFVEFSDKKQAWKDLIHILQVYYSDDYWRVRKVYDHLYEFKSLLSELDIAYAVNNIFPYVPDKQDAWCDLIRLADNIDIDSNDKTLPESIFNILVNIFSNIPKKKKSWDDLIRLMVKYGQYGPGKTIGRAFAHVPDKRYAWDELIRLMEIESYTRRVVIDALITAFPQVPNNKKAWSDLIRFTEDEDGIIRGKVVEALGSIFSCVSDKEQAWKDLIGLAMNKSAIVRWGIVGVLNSSFSHINNKEMAQEGLHQLTWNTDSDVRWNVALVIGSLFHEVPDKEKSWNDLHTLSCDLSPDVRQGAADALSEAFPYISDKEKAWNELHRLAHDEYIGVRRRAAHTLGSIYSHIPDGEQAWNDLINLTQDIDSEVQIFAYHSLGRACIYKATQQESEEDFGNELKKALEFFEQSSREATFFNPAKFCLPFYQSYFCLIFNKGRAEDEIQRYLSVAKSAVEGSESKENLLEAVENLSNALNEAQNARNLNRQKSDLNIYRKYCERAAELLDKTEKKAPGATKLLRRGDLIILKRIEELLPEIKEQAKTVCQISIGTDVEEIACSVRQEVQKWEISDQEQMRQKIDNLCFSLKTKIPDNQANRHIHDKIEGIKKEKDLVKQYQFVAILIASIPQIVIGGNMNGDINTNVSIRGNNINFGRNNVININQQQLAKIPDEYAKSLQSFSEAVNKQLKTYNIPQENVAHVQESINDLAKEIENIKTEEKISTSKKANIIAKISGVADGLLKTLPKTAAKATEILATFTPLAPFRELIGQGVEEIVKTIQNEI